MAAKHNSNQGTASKTTNPALSKAKASVHSPLLQAPVLSLPSVDVPPSVDVRGLRRRSDFEGYGDSGDLHEEILNSLSGDEVVVAGSATADKILVAQSQGATSIDATAGVDASGQAGTEGLDAMSAAGADGASIDPNALPATQAGPAGAAASSLGALEVGGAAAAVGAGAAAGAGAGAGAGAAAAATAGAGAAAGAAVTTAAAGPAAITGAVADGYVRGAKIYIDENGNGIADASEDTGVVTDAAGKFTLQTTKVGAILAVGGVNIDTGVVNTLVLKAPTGSTVINPLTTMVQAYLEAHPTATIAAAETIVQNGLGLPNIDLLSYDPLSAGDANAVAVQKKAAQLASVLIIAASDPSGTLTAAEAANAVIGNLLTAIGTGTGVPVNLADLTTLTSLLSNGAGGSVTDKLVTDIVTASSAIGSAANLGAIAAAQGQSLDTTPPSAPTMAPDLLAGYDSGVSATDNVTKVTSPVVRVSFNTTALDGSAAVTGNVVKVYAGITMLATVTLSATDIAAGYSDVQLSTLADGSYAVTAEISDGAGKISPASAALGIVIDTLAPGAPVIGAVAGDNV
ncbi:MAG: Ig-like domain-containing protein, partial [Betaproteobacteria bacterium]